MDTSKGRKLPTPQVQRQIPREQFINHPEFKERIASAMDGVEFPKEKIPAKYTEWLENCLKHVPFAILGMPIPFYFDLCFIDPEKMTFGLLQKGCDIIYNSNPDWHKVSMGEYYEMIRTIASMKDALSDITDPIRDKVIDDLMAADKIKKSGLVTA